MDMFLGWETILKFAISKRVILSIILINKIYYLISIQVWLWFINIYYKQTNIKFYLLPVLDIEGNHDPMSSLYLYLCFLYIILVYKCVYF